MNRKLIQLFYNNKSNKTYIKKSYLAGIIYYKQNLEYYTSELRIFGFPVWKKKIYCGKIKFYLFGLNYYIKSSRKFLYNEVLNKIDNRYKHIYLNFNCSGETYLTLAYLTPPEESVFIATKKYHVDLCRMIHPDIDCIYMPEVINLRSFDNVYDEEYRGRIFYNVLPFKHFIRLEKRIQKGEDIHYCEELCKTIGVEYTKRAALPVITEEIKQSALKKAKRIELNLDNFIFITPESMSNENPDKNFWCDITDKYYEQGFDVFINVIEQSPIYGSGKTCFLTFDEAYYIATLSKKIIGLRSGFIEVLSSIKNVPVTCYYTDFKDRGILKPIAAEKVMSAFSLKNLPNAIDENIIECIYQDNKSSINYILKFTNNPLCGGIYE